jgi:hypothetical protein
MAEQMNRTYSSQLNEDTTFAVQNIKSTQKFGLFGSLFMFNPVNLVIMTTSLVFAKVTFVTIMTRICLNFQMFGLQMIKQELVAVAHNLGSVRHLTDGTSSSASNLVIKNPSAQHLSPYTIHWFKVVGKFICKIKISFSFTPLIASS